MAVVPDPMNEPLKVVDHLFQQAVAASGKLPTDDFGVQSHFKSLITDDNVLKVRTAAVCVMSACGI